MRKLYVIMLAVVMSIGLFMTPATAHHKEGHATPPGHTQQDDLPEHNNEGPPGCEPSDNTPKKCKEDKPTEKPTDKPTDRPTEKPTDKPTEKPTETKAPCESNNTCDDSCPHRDDCVTDEPSETKSPTDKSTEVVTDEPTEDETVVEVPFEEVSETPEGELAHTGAVTYGLLALALALLAAGWYTVRRA